MKPFERRAFLKQLGLGAAVTGGERRYRRNGSRAEPGAQPTASRVRSVDMHSHWSPDARNKAFAAKVGKPPDEVNNPLYVDRVKRTQWMDQNGIQVHLLTMSGRMPWWQVSAADGAELARIINDEAIAWHTADPNRFFGAAELPVKDPQLALKELNRVAGNPGIRAVHVPNSIEGQDYLFEPAFEPVFARIEELGYPLTFHPARRRAEHVWRQRQARWQVGPEQSRRLSRRTLDDGGQVHRQRHAGQVSPAGGGAAARRWLVRVHRGAPGSRVQEPAAAAAALDARIRAPVPLRLAGLLARSAGAYVIDVVGSDRVVLGTDIYYADGRGASCRLRGSVEAACRRS